MPFPRPRPPVLLLIWVAADLATIQTDRRAITWDDLRDVTFKHTFFPEYAEYYLYPTFGKSVRLDSKVVSLKGYVIPMDAEGEVYVVSRFPMAQCYFCGGGGPETIVLLKFAKKPWRRYRTDEVRCFTGRLRLNAANPEETNFVLSEVRQCE